PLRKAAQKFPERVAVIEPEAGGKEFTYRWLDEKSSVLAASLARMKVEPGDRIGLWMKNSLGYILSFYGILKTGGIVVPVSTHYGEREVLYQLRETEVKGLITSHSLYAQVGNLIHDIDSLRFIALEGQGDLPARTISFSSLFTGPDRLDRSIGIDPREKIAVLPFSSGTTGLPKGVMLTHFNLLSDLYQVVQVHEVSETDVMINQLPFFHIYGMTVLMGTSVLAGATQVVASQFRPVDQFLSLFETYRPTLFFTVPLIIQEFCHHPKIPTMDWSRLRYVNAGGAILSPEVQKKFKEITGVPVMVGYGLTESSPTTHVTPIRKIKLGSIGLPLSLTEDRIVDPETERELPTREVGELWVRGPQVMKGYYNNPEATAQTLVNGWLRTGDLAWKDEEGYVFIVDRLKEVIKCKGLQVAPAEIEHILFSHPDIKDAAVVGEPHPEYGEAPVAYVVLKDRASLSAEAIIEYAAQGLAKYKRLARVAFTEAIPRSPSGKILRRLLKNSVPA
ncbi:MAG TPA: AMP-binding protein, partial [Thermodesulfobacteriota bacterium]|nr:AMP-binding protein [Thermodesulfobacteriota bacterium]